MGNEMGNSNSTAFQERETPVTREWEASKKVSGDAAVGGEILVNSEVDDNDSVETHRAGAGNDHRNQKPIDEETEVDGERRNAILNSTPTVDPVSKVIEDFINNEEEYPLIISSSETKDNDEEWEIRHSNGPFESKEDKNLESEVVGVLGESAACDSISEVSKSLKKMPSLEIENYEISDQPEAEKRSNETVTTRLDDEVVGVLGDCVAYYSISRVSKNPKEMPSQEIENYENSDQPEAEKGANEAITTRLDDEVVGVLDESAAFHSVSEVSKNPEEMPSQETQNYEVLDQPKAEKGFNETITTRLDDDVGGVLDESVAFHSVSEVSKSPKEMPSQETQNYEVLDPPKAEKGSNETITTRLDDEVVGVLDESVAYDSVSEVWTNPKEMPSQGTDHYEISDQPKPEKRSNETNRSCTMDMDTNEILQLLSNEIMEPYHPEAGDSRIERVQEVNYSIFEVESGHDYRESDQNAPPNSEDNCKELVEEKVLSPSQSVVIKDIEPGYEVESLESGLNFVPSEPHEESEDKAEMIEIAASLTGHVVVYPIHEERAGNVGNGSKDELKLLENDKVKGEELTNSSLSLSCSAEKEVSVKSKEETRVLEGVGKVAEETTKQMTGGSVDHLKEAQPAQVSLYEREEDSEDKGEIIFPVQSRLEPIRVEKIHHDHLHPFPNHSQELEQKDMVMESEKQGKTEISITDPPQVTQLNCSRVAENFDYSSTALMNWDSALEAKENSVQSALSTGCEAGPPFDVAESPGNSTILKDSATPKENKGSITQQNQENQSQDSGLSQRVSFEFAKLFPGNEFPALESHEHEFKQSKFPAKIDEEKEVTKAPIAETEVFRSKERKEETHETHIDREASIVQKGNSEKPRMPLVRQLKEGNTTVLSPQKQENPVEKKAVEEAWKSPDKKNVPDSPKVREKHRRRASLFSNCMCCTAVFRWLI